MTADPEVTRIVRSWLRTEEHESADRVLSNVLAVLDATPQRRPLWSPRRIAQMNGYAKLVAAVAAVLVVGVVGFNLLPAAGGAGGAGATPSASPSSTPTPTPSPTPSPTVAAVGWPSGSLDAGHHDVALELCDPVGRPCNPTQGQFSFDLPSGGWSTRYEGNLEVGTYPGSYAWIWFLGPIDAVSTDPCGGESAPVTPTAAEMADAVTTIGGTDATGPTDVTVGGRPAKLVELTIQDGMACDRSSFWLFGDSSFYPNALGSTIRMWFVDVDGEPFTVYADQDNASKDLEQEISQIVESITFE
jgi:hypothetical protein